MKRFRLQKRLILFGLGALWLADLGFAWFNVKLAAPQQNPKLILAEQTRQVKQLQGDIDRANKIRAGIPAVLKGFDEFENSLPQDKKAYSLISQELDEIARDTHLQIAETKFSQKELAGHNMEEMTVEASVVGEYSGIVHFLNRLQRSKNTYVVDFLEVDSNLSNQGQGPANSLKIGLHLKTYFRKT
jgi:Tfp pilus assembly protein PilO